MVNLFRSQRGRSRGILKKMLLSQQGMVAYLQIRTSPNRSIIPLKRKPGGNDTANLLNLLNLEHPQAWLYEAL